MLRVIILLYYFTTEDLIEYLFHKTVDKLNESVFALLPGVILPYQSGVLAGEVVLVFLTTFVVAIQIYNGE